MSAVETYAANRRAPLTLALSGSPEGMLVTLYIKPRATALTLAAALGVIYVGAGLGTAWWCARMPHNAIHVADVMLPWRWPALPDRHGQTLCAQGLEALRQEQTDHGIALLRRGLVSHPNDAPARRAVAETLAKRDDYDGVRSAVLPQLAFPPVPRDLLEVLFTEAMRMDDPATIAECGERLATQAGAETADQIWLQLRRARALLALQKPEAALAVVEAPALRASDDAAEVRVEALCVLGRASEAMTFAGERLRATPLEAQQRLRLLARAQRAGGKQPELVATLTQLVALAPESSDVRVFAIEQLWAANLHDDAQRELRDLLRLVAGQSDGLASLAPRLGEIAPELAKRCVDEARTRGQPTDAISGAWVLAGIHAADWPAAEEAFAAMFGEKQSDSDRELRTRRLLRATIDVGAQGTSRAVAELKNDVEAAPLKLGTYLRTAEGLARAQRWDAVLIVAESGQRTFRRSVTLQRLATEARMKAATRASAGVEGGTSAASAGARGPDLGQFDATTFLARVNERLQREEWDAAAELIGAARRAEPSWFRGVAPELDWLEAQAAFGRGDRLRVVQMIGFALKWSHRDVDRALDFARRYHALGDRDAELAIARKVAEIAPDSPAAQRTLAELEHGGK